MAFINVTNGNDSGAGSLRAALAAASNGDVINFSPGVTTIDLTSSLVIAKNVTIEGSAPGKIGTPGVTINGGGGSSSFSDFVINAGVTATLDGLIIADGNATGATGSAGTFGEVGTTLGAGGTGAAAAGGIYDAGSLTLTNSVLQNDTATGGTGGAGYTGVVHGSHGPYLLDLGSGGGAGGNAAGGIYVAHNATLNLSASDTFSNDSAHGGNGGQGGGSADIPYGTYRSGGAGGGGGISGINGGSGFPGRSGLGGGAGGAPGQPGSSGGYAYVGNRNVIYLPPSGGGGGGTAFADVGGKGTVNLTSAVVTNNSDDVNTIGSLRYDLAHIVAGGTITFAPSVTTIDFTSSLVITKNVTIEGLQPGATTPGVTINGGGSSSNFVDFTINAGVTATLDGLIIADGNATGATGSAGTFGEVGTTLGAGGTGAAAAGGIYDAGSLTLTNSVLQNDTATGGTGGAGYTGVVHGSHGPYLLDLGSGGGAGGNAAGGIYVAHNATLNLSASDTFSNDSAHGGNGGQGGGSANIPYGTYRSGGAGGGGGISGINGGSGFPGRSGLGGGAGGAPGQPGSSGGYAYVGNRNVIYLPPSGGGGGGTAFADVGGKGTINSTLHIVTNDSDDINTVGSLRYEIAHASAGDTIVFDASVTTIDLGSTLEISKSITIEGLQPGATTPGVTINGGGAGSNFSDFTIDDRANVTLDGLIIANGHATGTAGSTSGSQYGIGGTGGAAAGGVFVSSLGELKLTNSVLQNDSATGGAGGGTTFYGAGGGGGAAAGGIYVATKGLLYLYASDSFSNDSATGGRGGSGGSGYNAPSGYGGGFVAGGSGGAGGVSGVNGGNGSHGATGPGGHGGAGGAGGTAVSPPGQAGSAGQGGGGYTGPGGGGGGGKAFADAGGAGFINGPVPCYCPGTLICTARSETRVENLKIGDKVMTASGTLRPIKWIGRRSYGGRFIRGDKDILPICVKAGALDDNVPRRDLWVSPHHAMYLAGVLVEAKDLVNGVSIVQAERVETVEYFHVELDNHDVIIAEGALAESYIDDDNRMMFHNAQDYVTRYREAVSAPKHYCAPRLDDGYEVERIRHHIASRAGILDASGGERASALRGYIDEVTPKRIAGWAQNPDRPDVPVCLDVFAGGQMIGQVLANAYRADLSRAGIGSGHHAFTFVPPQGIARGAVEVRRSLDGAVLARGPNAGAFMKVHRRAQRT